MNRTEQRALAYLKRSMNLKDDEVECQPDIPEFRTKGGRLWGAKLLYFGKTAVFYPGELEKLTSNLEKTVLLLFDEKGSDPVKQVPVRVLADSPDGYETYRFSYVQDRWHQNAGPPGEIVIPITRRNATSRYWRVNHMPMDSLTWYENFDARLVKSVDSHSRTGAFLVLRPAL